MRKPVDQSFRSASFDSSRVCLDKHLPFPFPPNLQAHKNGRLVVFAGGVHPAALAVGGVIMVGVGAENDSSWSRLILKVIILPRQARDKHTEKLRGGGGVSAGVVGVGAVIILHCVLHCDRFNQQAGYLRTTRCCMSIFAVLYISLSLPLLGNINQRHRNIRSIRSIRSIFAGYSGAFWI